MNAQEIVDSVAARIGVDPAVAEKAVGMLLSVLEHESGGTAIAGIFSKIPGADDLARNNDVMAASGGQGGGLFSSLTSALGGLLGDKAGAMVNGFSQLQSLGLDTGQIEQAGETLISQAKTAAGPTAFDSLVEAVPALKGHFGL